MWKRSGHPSQLSEHELLARDPLALRDEALAEADQCFARGEIDRGGAALAALRFATIDESTLARSDRHLRALAGGRRLVATTDPRRTPSEDEVVIVYGNYPHFFGNVVVNNPIRRHVTEFGELPHDAVEFDGRWADVGRICVINADRRRDRLDAVMRELAAARAPLDRVERIAAREASPGSGRPELDGALGCLQSHLVALERIAGSGCAHALVLEDDFCFTSDIETHLDDLAEFLARDEDYAVCLLATSKHGHVEPRDELVSVSRQPVTNTSAYLVARARLSSLVKLQQQALERLTATGDTGRWAADRAWAALQPSGRFLVFRRKMGFQAAGYSDIEGRITRYLD